MRWVVTSKLRPKLRPRINGSDLSKFSTTRKISSSQLQRDDGSPSGDIDCALIGRSQCDVTIKSDILKPISDQLLMGMTLTTAPVSSSPFTESCQPCTSSTLLLDRLYSLYVLHPAQGCHCVHFVLP